MKIISSCFIILRMTIALHLSRTNLLIKKVATSSFFLTTLITPLVHNLDSSSYSIGLIAPASADEATGVKKGTMDLPDPETISLFNKAISEESDGDFAAALKDYQQVIQVAPDYIIGWANIGNVLTSQGNLNDALLCYKKAISLYPPSDTLAVILLNKASIEMSTGQSAEAIKDLQSAELLAGPNSKFLSLKAVALTNEGRWDDALQIFEKIVSSSERNALPWWLRYSMSLLEVGRGVEAVGYYQRTLKSFPREPEIKAYGVALYMANGAPTEAASYWKELSEADQKMYTEPDFVRKQLKWGSITVQNWEKFLRNSYHPSS